MYEHAIKTSLRFCLTSDVILKEFARSSLKYPVDIIKFHSQDAIKFKIAPKTQLMCSSSVWGCMINQWKNPLDLSTVCACTGIAILHMHAQLERGCCDGIFEYA